MSVDEHSEMHKYATDRVATKRKEETINIVAWYKMGVHHSVILFTDE